MSSENRALEDEKRHLEARLNHAESELNVCEMTKEHLRNDKSIVSVIKRNVILTGRVFSALKTTRSLSNARCSTQHSAYKCFDTRNRKTDDVSYLLIWKIFGER